MRAFVLWSACIFALLSGALLHAVEIIDGPQVRTAASTTTITWKTDVECGTRLQYGLDAAQLGEKVEGVTGSVHEVTLQGLAPGTTYHFSVGSARTRLATGTFTTVGNADTAPTSIVRRVIDAFKPEKKSRPRGHHGTSHPGNLGTARFLAGSLSTSWT